MSNEALTWAKKVKTGSSSAKSVLLVMADDARAPEHLSFKTVETICDETELNRKTVMPAIKRLIEIGLIETTGERKGRTRNVPVYRLNVGNSPKTGTINKDETVPKPAPFIPSNSPEIGTVEQSQNRDCLAAETVPIFPGNGPNFGTQNPIEPKDIYIPPLSPKGENDSKKLEAGSPAKSFDLIADAPPEINSDAWTAWVEFRASKRKKISEKAARQQWKRLSRWGPEDQAEIISRSIENDYQGLFDEFLEKRHAAQARQHQAGFAGPQRLSTVEAASRAAEEYRQKLRRQAGNPGSCDYPLAANG